MVWQKPWGKWRVCLVMGVVSLGWEQERLRNMDWLKSHSLKTNQASLLLDLPAMIKLRGTDPSDFPASFWGWVYSASQWRWLVSYCGSRATAQGCYVWAGNAAGWFAFNCSPFGA